MYAFLFGTFCIFKFARTCLISVSPLHLHLVQRFCREICQDKCSICFTFSFTRLIQNKYWTFTIQYPEDVKIVTQSKEVDEHALMWRVPINNRRDSDDVPSVVNKRSEKSVVIGFQTERGVVFTAQILFYIPDYAEDVIYFFPYKSIHVLLVFLHLDKKFD